jgi:hypothetical protein
MAAKRATVVMMGKSERPGPARVRSKSKINEKVEFEIREWLVAVDIVESSAFNTDTNTSKQTIHLQREYRQGPAAEVPPTAKKASITRASTQQRPALNESQSVTTRFGCRRAEIHVGSIYCYMECRCARLKTRRADWSVAVKTEIGLAVGAWRSLAWGGVRCMC